MLFAALFYGLQNSNRKPHLKVTKLKSKFYLFLGYINRAPKNPAKELSF